jgi:threonine dehydratase
MQDRRNIRGKRVGLILSGGNIDFDLFRKWVGPEAAVGAEQQVAV